jgi:hypothetical protein
MIAKLLLLNEATLKPAGTLAEGAAVVGDADGAVVGDADGAVVGEAVVADDELLWLLPHAVISPASPNTAALTSNRRGRR